MAVSRDQRHQGLGTALLRQMMHDAFSEYDYFVLSAQERAVDFYRRLGFYVVSDSYMDAGIPHRGMRCTAPGLLLDQEPETGPLPAGLGHHQLADQGRDGSAAAGASPGRSGHPAVLALRHHAQPRSLRRPFPYRALSRLARRSRHSDVRFLIHDDYPLVKKRHRLVQLMRRLPSRISLGLVNTTYPHGDRPCVIVDDSGVLIRHDFEHIEGFANFSAPRRVRPFGEDFDGPGTTAANPSNSASCRSSAPRPGPAPVPGE